MGFSVISRYTSLNEYTKTDPLRSAEVTSVQILTFGCHEVNLYGIIIQKLKFLPFIVCVKLFKHEKKTVQYC